MPILTVEHVTDQPLASDAARRIANAVAEVLEADVARVWVRLRHLPRMAYAENDIDVAPAPFFVEMLVRAWPSEEVRATQSTAVCTAIARTLDVKVERVHLLWAPPAAGRVAFGGELVRTS